jgi:hypothetical protein
MKRLRSQSLAAAIAVVLALGATAAHAGVMDFLFGKKETSAATTSTVDSRKRSWQISQFTAVRLAPRESGAAPNQQPVSLSAEGLQQQLALIRTTVDGKSQALFYSEELKDLAEPLAEALSVAGPNDDLLLLSTSRRGEGVLATPYGITGRMFVQNGELNFIVHDTRKDFVNAYLGTHIAPQFDFGSRAKAGGASIQSAGAASKRADWIALPIAAAAVAPTPAALATPVPAPLQPATAARVVPVAVPVAPVSAPAPAPASRDEKFYEEQARRLKGLKALRDQNAITEEEYQQKRKEILSTL